MARVKIRMGENEVEVDSRDFYIDNQSIGQVIGEVSRHLQTTAAACRTADKTAPDVPSRQAGLDYLKSLDDAEVHEPEFSAPVQVSGQEVKPKLAVLERDAFFDMPRTVSETVDQLLEYGWIASPLEVSRTLTKMVLQRELTKDSQNSRNCYSVKESIVAS